MRAKLTAVAVFAAVTAIVAAAAAAGPSATKQRVAIEHNGSSFVLTPLTPGAVKADSGTASFCCWSDRHTIRDGQAVEINDPQMTLSGKRGTLVAQNRIAWVDVPDGWSIFTGTWKVVRATGQYARLVGGGRAAGVESPGGEKARFEGFLHRK
jgi:hypothetical protein